VPSWSGCWVFDNRSILARRAFSRIAPLQDCPPTETPEELRSFAAGSTKSSHDEGYLVARIVHRRDLDQAVGTL
jgi:hypothetical protein